MTIRKPLPATLNRSFRVAEGRAAGASRKRLLARDLIRPFHGVRTTGSDRRAALVAAMTADQAFAGPTAALVWDLPLPRRWAEDERLHVVSAGPGRIRRRGVVSSRRPGLAACRFDGLPVLTPESTWLSLAGLLSPSDLTAVADRLVSGTRDTPPLSSITALRHAIQRAGSTPGIRDLRRAIDDVRVGAWSRPETLLRLLVCAAGIPEPVLNQPVLLADGDVAYPDLAWPGFRVAVEYDGTWHDDKRRRAADVERHEKLADVGWLVMHVRGRDLFGSPSAVVARVVRRLRERGFALPHRIEWAHMPRLEP
jgi:hypothetical protein